MLHIRHLERPLHSVARFTVVAISAFLAITSNLDAQEPARPNIVIILVDDMGFSDVGCYGGEIETPHIDKLAANGMRFTQFYNSGRC